MTDSNPAIVPWSATEAPAILLASSPGEIAEIGNPHLTHRDISSIAAAFDHHSYEMATTFIWTKASSVLKKQIASLGMDFVGEMLRRPDLNEDSDPSKSLSDAEAISLAEDLGMVTVTQSFRLGQALDLVTHFTQLEGPEADVEAMTREEAVNLLRTCIQAILSKPNIEGALKFADFRQKLTSETLREEECQALKGSPRFVIRTTLSVLLSEARKQKGAAQEHALGNLSVILPLIWSEIKQPDKWQVGQAYAEAVSEGNRIASTGLRTALLKVKGFDFVPESLRSHTFTQAAAGVLAAHFAYNNFFNEEKPLSILASLGTAIPQPAFPKCMEAILAVYLGNKWGHAYTSETLASEILSGLRHQQWEYYINECLVSDRTVLDKLAYDDKPTKRWISMIEKYVTKGFVVKDKEVLGLMQATSARNIEAIHEAALSIRTKDSPSVSRDRLGTVRPSLIPLPILTSASRRRLTAFFTGR